MTDIEPCLKVSQVETESAPTDTTATNT